MNAVEIEQAVSALSERPFDRAEFPFAFLEAFDRKATTLKKLRSGESNKSDVGGVLQTGHIHIAVAPEGEVGTTLAALKASPATAKAKARFVLATDGITLEAEDLRSDAAPVVCSYADLPDRFGFFLPLAGITTVARVSENAFDIRATARLNKLYLELRELNPDWDGPERRPEMNHFLARLIFCFFAQSTDIFLGDRLFSDTVEQMGARDGSDTHVVIETIFRAMSLKDRAGLPRWADAFPFVNGGLFSGSTDVPRFSGIARAHLRHIGSLDWRKINPDIFGSMIQAVADDAERGALGMHYTSVPNILKVLNPLFLDELNAKLAEAGDNARTLLNLRRRMARIRVFDPACGSGNFLVIAYKEMREIEAEINRRRGEQERRSDIPLTNFRGIEIRDFPAEIARLALIIAEYQCDVTYRGQKEALQDFLPLDAENWITCGNALRLDWLSICPPTGTEVKFTADDLFATPLDQAKIDFENEGGETYICGNPQFKGARKQTKSQKEDMHFIFGGGNAFKDCDYVTAWYLKASGFIECCRATFAFVSTSSIAEGEQVAHLWSRLYADGCHIIFAHRGFKWRNNASDNAGVHCVIIGVGSHKPALCALYDGDTRRSVEFISPYVIAGPEIYVETRDVTLFHEFDPMVSGSMARDGGNLLLSFDEANKFSATYPETRELLRFFVGSQELVHYRNRLCLWIEDDLSRTAMSVPIIADRVERVRLFRKGSSAKTTNGYASIPHKFAQRAHKQSYSIAIAKTSSEKREYIPADLLNDNTVISDAAFAIYGPKMWELAIVLSRMHFVWISTVCGKLESRLRYSSTLGWNTFPAPTLLEKNRGELSRCAQDILLAREGHFPATIADLYDPDNMPADLRAAHDRNDEVLERIYIGRRFRNDTERLEKLFDLYTRTVAERTPAAKASKPKAARTRAGA